MKASGRAIFPLLIAGLLIFVTGIPYIYASLAGGEEFIFGGFLLNPLDGNTYLAKMRQGWQGYWRFRLPFTADPGEGAFLFIFYLSLGHLSRWLGLPLLATFHLARSLSIILLALTINRFLQTQISDRLDKNLALVLAIFGSGLGWIALPLGGFTVDFWVAEAYPFLSAYSNPHFPLGVSLMLMILIPGSKGWRNWLTGMLTGLGLALVLPFGVLVAMAVSGLVWLVRRSARAWLTGRLLAVAVGAGGILLYDAWVVQAMPALASWNAQNQTPSPEVLDLLLSFSPAILVGIAGAFLAYRRGTNLPLVSSIWVAAVLVLMYLPFNLQRRLIMGLYLPVSALAVIGLRTLARENSRRFKLWAAGLILFSLPTNLILLLTAWQASNTHAPILYLTVEELRAMEWVLDATAEDSLVLAAPETGLFIPGWAGRFVVYGHPFETVNAAEMERAVTAFYAEHWGTPEGEGFIASEKVDYVFWGPRERALGASEALKRYPVAYESQTVTIYEARTQRAAP